MVKLPRTLGLALGLAALAMVLTGLGTAYAQVVPQVPLPGNKIPQFVDPLPLLDLQGGPMETVVLPGAAETTLTMQEFKANVMPTGFVPANGLPYAGTTVWGYRKTAPPAPAGTYLGPVFVAARDVPTQIKFVNNLGETSTSNLLFWKTAVDQTLHWADPLGGEANDCNMNIVAKQPPSNVTLPSGVNCAQNYSGPIPAVPHLHGGEVPPVLDGGPDAWFLSNAAATFDFTKYPNAKKYGHGFYTKPDFIATSVATLPSPVGNSGKIGLVQDGNATSLAGLTFDFYQSNGLTGPPGTPSPATTVFTATPTPRKPRPCGSTTTSWGAPA